MTPARSSAGLRTDVALGLVLVVLGAFAYAPSVAYDFAWDDEGFIVENPDVRGDSGLGEAVAHDFAHFGGQVGAYHGLWRPATTLYYRAVFALGGGRPGPFHAGSVALHVLVTLLLYALVRRRAGSLAAFAAAALFSLHPLRSESVCWISGVGDILCGAFLLGALHAVAAAPQHRPRRALLLALGSFALASSCKEVAFLLPVFLLLPWWPETTWRERVRGAAPFFAVACGLFLLRTTVVNGAGAVPVPAAQRLATGIALVGRYLVTMIWPGRRVLHSALGPVTSPTDPEFLASLLVLPLLVVAIVRQRRRAWVTAAIPALGWTALFLMPVCFFSYSETLFAERYTYVPALGFSVFLGAGLVAWGRRIGDRWARFRAAAVALGVVALLGMALTTRERGRAWRDSETLYRAMLVENPRDPQALFALGLRYARAGRLDEARPLFAHALEVAPQHSGVLNSMGNFARLDGDALAALRFYERAYRASTANSEALLNKAMTLDDLGRCGEARATYRQFLAIAGPASGAERAEATRSLARVENRIAAGQCR